MLKPYTATVLFASGKFTHELIASNFEQFKYKWVWIKNAPTLFVHAKNRPMRRYEEIVVFSDGVMNHSTCSSKRMKYNPQGVHQCSVGEARTEQRGGKKKFKNAVGSRPSHKDFYFQENTGYPSDVLYFKVPYNVSKIHPNQKPVDLLEYLIKTYTNEGETVLDATMGSGSTGVACMNTGRKFIGFETEKNFFDIAEKRISEALAQKQQELFTVAE